MAHLNCNKPKYFDYRSTSLCWRPQTDLLAPQLLSYAVGPLEGGQSHEVHVGLFISDAFSFDRIRACLRLPKITSTGFTLQISPSFFSRMLHGQLDFCIRKRNKAMHNLTFFKQWNEFRCTLTENSLSILCFHWDFFGLYQLKAFASHLLTDKEFKFKMFLRHTVQLEYPNYTGIDPYAFSHRAKGPFFLLSKIIFYNSVYFHSIHPDLVLCLSAPRGVNVNLCFMLWLRLCIFFSPQSLTSWN